MLLPSRSPTNPRNNYAMTEGELQLQLWNRYILLTAILTIAVPFFTVESAPDTPLIFIRFSVTAVAVIYLGFIMYKQTM